MINIYMIKANADLSLRKDNEMVGLVELVEIDYIHRRTEFQIIIDPNYQGYGYAVDATRLAMDYAFPY